ncbi:MAG: T9SS type A sorting domain-containing protein, partial [Candidatus Cloacimonetes bacterium]|nr:T9SS type A sorting domain-containing protein [Candidatus Cloacimonadota bacterium]
MKKLIILLNFIAILLIFSSIVFATIRWDDTTLQGYVYDENNQPLEGVGIDIIYLCSDSVNSLTIPEWEGDGHKNDLPILTRNVLYPNYPNPFFDYGTIIGFYLEVGSIISLFVYDYQNDWDSTSTLNENYIVDTLMFNQWCFPGHHTWAWSPIFDSISYTTGVYIFRLESDGYVRNRLMLYINSGIETFSNENLVHRTYTDEDGFYIISGDFPIDEIIDLFDENGTYLGESNVAPMVKVAATYPTTGTLIDSIILVMDETNILNFYYDGTSVDNNMIFTRKLSLSNYPNPFNPDIIGTTIRYYLNSDFKVTLEIYNLKGQKVKTLVNDNMKAGSHNILWNGRDSKDNPVSSGIYFYKIIVGNYIFTKKM